MFVIDPILGGRVLRMLNCLIPYRPNIPKPLPTGDLPEAEQPIRSKPVI